MKHLDSAKYMRLLLGVAAALTLAACASIGRPEGGEIDEVPPVFVKSNPLPGAVNVERGRMVIEFDENVQIKDAMSKVTVSPVQKTVPQVSAVARKVTVELRDTLIPNTTYTIDFADAISDLNEGNEIDGFSVAFSTGPDIDTLCMSGMVFEAANLEPAQGMIVGVYSNLSDTAVRTLPMERITKTNKYGQFTLRNLKPGKYRIYALNDKNRDYKWDRTEDVAFYDAEVEPTTAPGTVTDTILNAAGDIDSIVTRQVTMFYPNDILLTWFNENYKSQYLVKYERPVRERLHFEFGAPADTFPAISILNGPRPGLDISKWAAVSGSKTLDTLDYWITDPEVLMLDSITVTARYKRTDTLGMLSWGTDTLKINLRNLKKLKAEQEKKEKERRKRMEKGDTAGMNDGPEPVFVKFAFTSGATQELNKPLAIKAETPIAGIDTSAVHMKIAVDTLWVDVESPRFRFVDSLQPQMMVADYVWKPGEKYKVTMDSMAVVDVFGCHSRPIEFTATTRKLEDYTTLNFTVSGTQQPAMVQLLNAQDNPVMTVPVKDGKALFRYVLPGTYYARMWIDANNNGLYDGGILDSIQPEEVYYLPKKLTLKRNWDVEQAWNIYEVPIDLQKPLDIKKNKPKTKRGEENVETDEEEDFYDPTDPFGKRGGSKRKNSPSLMVPGVGGLSKMSDLHR